MGGLAHGALDAGAGGVAGFPLCRGLLSAGAGERFVQFPGAQRDLAAAAAGAQLACRAGYARVLRPGHHDRLVLALPARVQGLLVTLAGSRMAKGEVDGQGEGNATVQKIMSHRNTTAPAPPQRVAE